MMPNDYTIKPHCVILVLLSDGRVAMTVWIGDFLCEDSQRAHERLQAKQYRIIYDPSRLLMHMPQLQYRLLDEEHRNERREALLGEACNQSHQAGGVGRHQYNANDCCPPVNPTAR